MVNDDAKCEYCDEKQWDGQPGCGFVNQQSARFLIFAIYHRVEMEKINSEC